MSDTIECDVAIIGGGPGGSATGSLLKKYRPDLEVAIVEKDTFPREHVGESLLPSVCRVLHEMGCWDEVERANFPIKIGATYRWGRTRDLWDFEFLPVSEYKDEARPAKYAGIRPRTAFQVDRSIFDRILLDCAKNHGCKVFEGTRVSVQSEGQWVTRLRSNGTTVVAKWYVDASGCAAVLRRALQVPIEEPTSLKNVAFWDYWENTDWAVSIGSGATRILVLTVSWGWIWFIPLGPTRTSIGLVCPAEYYKKSGLSTEALYEKAISEEPKIRELTRNATREGRVRGTRDWSFISSKLAGENWFLVGECAGFADPILSAGITLTVTGARELAHTLSALLPSSGQAVLDPDWLKTSYEDNQIARIRQHIRFADFWYSGNGQFSDLKEFTAKIAADAGLSMTADQAFQWLGTGGFATDITQLPAIADISTTGIKLLAQRFASGEAGWALNGISAVRLNLERANSVWRPVYREGKVERIRAHERCGKVLPQYGFYGMVLEALTHEQSIKGLAEYMTRRTAGGPRDPLPFLFQVLEGWLSEGWLVGEKDPRFPTFIREPDTENLVIHSNRDIYVTD